MKIRMLETSYLFELEEHEQCVTKYKKDEDTIGVPVIYFENNKVELSILKSIREAYYFFIKNTLTDEITQVSLQYFPVIKQITVEQYLDLTYGESSNWDNYDYGLFNTNVFDILNITKNEYLYRAYYTRYDTYYEVELELRPDYENKVGYGLYDLAREHNHKSYHNLSEDESNPELIAKHDKSNELLEKIEDMFKFGLGYIDYNRKKVKETCSHLKLTTFIKRLIIKNK